MICIKVTLLFTVEYMNLSVAVMGEVNNPGRFSIDKDNLTILDALSQAGDLTIYGKREKVLVLRKEEGKQRFMVSISVRLSIFILHLPIICNRMMWYMWSLMPPKPVSLP